MTVKWPTDAIDKDEHDLQEPLTTLLTALDLTGDYDKGDGPIVADTLALTNQVKRGVTAVGSFSAFASIGGGLWAAGKSNTPLAIAVVASAAFVLGMAVLAYAKILDADISGRAAAITERYRATATVASSYLDTATTYSDPPAAPAPAAVAPAVDLSRAPNGHARKGAAKHR